MLVMAAFPEAGKIQQEFFSELIFPYCGRKRDEVMVGPGYGIDVSVVRLPGNMVMALTSDPLSLIPSLGLRESAWLSVQILANDMVTTGFAPMYAQLVLNLPENISVADFNTYWNHVHDYCDAIGIAITGGHTGQVFNQLSTVAGGGTFIAIAPENQVMVSSMAQPGNVIIVTKECALTASSILAMSFPETVRNKCGKEVYEQGCELFYNTTSLQDGLTAATIADGKRNITAMHDVTEGGVLGAIYEMATAANCGVELAINEVAVGEAQRSICKLFNIDPHFVIGAGSMIIAAEADKAAAVIKHLKDNTIHAAVVGKFTTPEKGKWIIENDTKTALVHPGIDAYWNTFYKAFAAGWE
jgi:hydrogenase expression/formation protein HypE